MLGVFDLAPMQEILGIGEIGDGAVVAAGRAKSLRLLGSHQPVADIVVRIGAEPVALALSRERAPYSVSLFQRGHHFLMRQIAQAQPAALAFRIFEIDRLAAILALEKFHDEDALTAAARVHIRTRTTGAGRGITRDPLCAAKPPAADSRSSPSDPRPAC